MLSVLLAVAAAAPVIGLGWWLRSSGRTAERYHGRLNVRVCALLIATGMFVFAFVNAVALGTPVRAAAGVGVWAACVMTAIAVLPMAASRVISRKTRQGHLPW